MPSTNVPRRPVGRPPAPVMERFLKFVKVLPNGCWEWLSKINKWGYGRFYYEGKDWQAHRVSHILFKGPIPEGMDIDHNCHNLDLSCAGGIPCRHRRCVNPGHIEAVSEKVNIQRGRRANGRKTHCPQGHPYDERNTYAYVGSNGKQSRMCTTCQVMRNREQAARLRRDRQPRRAVT